MKTFYVVFFLREFTRLMLGHYKIIHFEIEKIIIGVLFYWQIFQKQQIYFSRNKNVTYVTPFLDLHGNRTSWLSLYFESSIFVNNLKIIRIWQQRFLKLWWKI